MAPPDLEARVRKGISRVALQRHVEALCQWERVSGKEGEAKAADYIASILKAEGIPHEIHEFDAYVSYPEAASLVLDPPLERPLKIITHSFGASTPSEGLTAPLVEAGNGSPHEMARTKARGAIVVTLGMALPWVTTAVQAAGAVGHVNVCRNRLPHEMCLSPVWGTPGPDELHLLPTIPVVSVDEVGGDAVLEALRSSPSTTGTLSCRVWRGWAPLKLPLAEVAGPRTSTKFVLVGSHYDSWHRGATDTATTDALLLEMARILRSMDGELRRGVRVAWWPGHSQGRYAGSQWYADHNWGDLESDAVAYLNLDGGGALHASTFVLAHTAELGDFNLETVKGITGWATEEAADDELLDIKGRPARNADQSFLGIGIPSLAAYSEMPRAHPERGVHAAASGGGWWWHTSEDTTDKVDYGVLHQEATLFTVQVLRLANLKVLPFVMKHTAEDFINALHAYRNAAGEWLDFEPARQEARRFREDCGNLEIHRRAVEATGDEWKAASLNETLLRLTRILNPLLYSASGAFHPDPATPAGLLPGLRAARDLMELQKDQRAFALVPLVRELARVTQGLSQASELLEGHLREEMEED